MFVIDQVVEDKDYSNFERFDIVSSSHIEPSATRQPLYSCKILPELNRIFVGIPTEIQAYSISKSASNWLSTPVKFPLYANILNINKDEERSSAGFETKVNKELGEDNQSQVDVLDMAFLPSKDILFVLRSDLCVEFHRFKSRSKFGTDTIEQVGGYVVCYLVLNCRG
jgi:hypothetical protein